MSRWKTVSYGLPHHSKKKPDTKPPAWLGAEGFEDLTEQYLANTSQDQEKHKEFLEYEKEVLADIPNYKAIFPMKYETSDSEDDTHNDSPRGGQRFYTESDLLKLLRLRGFPAKEGTPGGFLFTNVRRKNRELSNKQDDLKRIHNLREIFQECIHNNLDENDEYDVLETKKWAREIRDNMIAEDFDKFRVRLAGKYFNEAIHLFFNNRDDENQDTIVFGALQNVRKFAGGKARRLTHKDEPLLDMRNFGGFGDLVAWEARCYCWASHQTDLDVSEVILNLIAQSVAILEDREEDQDDETSGDDSSEEDDFDESTETLEATTEDVDSSFTLAGAPSNDDLDDTVQYPDFEEINAVRPDSPSDRFTSRNFTSSPPSLPKFATLFPRERMDTGCTGKKSATLEDDDEVSRNLSGFESLEADSDDELEVLFSAKEGLAREAGQRLA